MVLSTKTLNRQKTTAKNITLHASDNKIGYGRVLFWEVAVDTIVNGEPNESEFQHDIDPPDRAIKLPNITIEFSRTPNGGWKERSIHCYPPDGGGNSGGIALATIAKNSPWLVE